MYTQYTHICTRSIHIYIHSMHIYVHTVYTYIYTQYTHIYIHSIHIYIYIYTVCTYIHRLGSFTTCHSPSLILFPVMSSADLSIKKSHIKAKKYKKNNKKTMKSFSQNTDVEKEFREKSMKQQTPPPAPPPPLCLLFLLLFIILISCCSFNSLNIKHLLPLLTSLPLSPVTNVFKWASPPSHNLCCSCCCHSDNNPQVISVNHHHGNTISTSVIVCQEVRGGEETQERRRRIIFQRCDGPKLSSLSSFASVSLCRTSAALVVILLKN